MIILTETGLVSITALPDPDSSWLLVRANREQDIRSFIPGVPIRNEDVTNESGWRFACIAPRWMVTTRLAACIESLSQSSDAVSVQDQQLAELEEGIIAIAAEMPWIITPHSDAAQPSDMAPPVAPPPDPAGSELETDTSTSTPKVTTFDCGVDHSEQSLPVTYDGLLPVTTEDPYDPLIPAEPTLCQLSSQHPAQAATPSAADH